MSGDDVFCTSNGTLPTVGGEDDDRGNAGFKSAVKVGEAFDVKHVDL